MRTKECVAMLLAGGEGRRLGPLTKNLAKPAVPFGGKYRIIDFPLSNCTNSGISAVGVLTQYKPMILNSYIGIGSPWDLDRKNGGVFVLPPFVEQQGGSWYKGTANAIYQNLCFIEQYDPKYVLVISGDHIYKMDYSKMINFHEENNAEATIAVIEVPWNETDRFGIMSTDENNKITEFAEKPENANSNLASMGVYIFNYKTLRDYLERDDQDVNSSNDFGKNIIPMMLNEDCGLFAYPFDGYWKDVGTIESYWEASMDLLAEDLTFDIFDRSWRIYSVNPNQPPQYIAPGAQVKSSLISEGCLVYSNVFNSVLFPGVSVGEGSIVEDSIIMTGAKIGKNVTIKKSIVSIDAVIENDCTIGASENSGITLIEEGEKISQGTKKCAHIDVLK